MISQDIAQLAGPFTKIAAAMSRQHNVQVIPSGGRCSTNGKVIYVPFTADYATPETRAALHGLLDHEVAHVCEEREHTERGEQGVIALMNAEAKDAEGRLVGLWMNALEDVRIETKYARIYPGVADNLAAAFTRSMELIAAAKKRPGMWTQLVCAAIALSKGSESPTLHPELEELAEVAGGFAERAKVAPNAAAIRKLALETIAALRAHGLPEGSESEPKPKPGDEPSEPSEDGTEVIIAGDLEGGLPEDEASDIMEPLRGGVEKSVAAETADRYNPAPDSKALDQEIEAQTSHRSEAKYQQIKEEMIGSIGALRRRQLSVIQTQTRARNQRNLSRGELDGCALAGVRLGERNIFQQSIRGRTIDTAIMLLIDLSGSMGSNECEGSGAYYALRTAVALAEAWSQLRVTFEVLGWDNAFTSRRDDARVDGFDHPSPLRIKRIKRFSESLRSVRGKFMEIDGGHSNNDGDAVWYAARELSARPEKRRILVVISDGYPACQGVEGPILAQHLKDTVRAITSRSDIEVIGIGAGSRFVSQFYTEETGSRHVVIDDLETLAPKVFRVMQAQLQQHLRAS